MIPGEDMIFAIETTIKPASHENSFDCEGVSFKMTKYQAWQFNDGCSFSESEHIAELKINGTIPEGAEFLYEIEANTWEEARSVHNLRMGWGPYNPEGAAEPCPKCSAFYYPQGSGQCWRCGEIC